MFKAILLVLMMSGHQYALVPNKAPTYTSLQQCQANLEMYNVLAERWARTQKVEKYSVKCMNHEAYNAEYLARRVANSKIAK